MSSYGVGVYGNDSYGSGEKITYSAAIFNAISTNYREITLFWTNPGNPPEKPWDYLMVVRNMYGHPLDPDDGVIIHESASGSGMTSPDTNLPEGAEVYYALFVRDTDSQWHRSAIATGLSVKNFGTARLMMDYLPSAVKSLSRTVVDANEENPDLRAFINLVAFEYDRIKTQAYLIRGAIDPKSAPVALMNPLLYQMGLSYEPTLGYQRMRTMAANAISLYQSRGSWDGLNEFIRAFTGYNLEVTVGKNMFLDYNASSFEETPTTVAVPGPDVQLPGLWVIDNATGLSVFQTGLPVGTDDRKQGALEVSAGTGTVVMACGEGVDQMIPIPTTNLDVESSTQSVDYTFSIYSKSATGGRTINIGVEWYNIFGDYLSTSTASFTDGTSWTRGSVTDTAPYAKTLFLGEYVTDFALTAAFARPVIDFDYEEEQYFDAAQFEQSSTATTFEDARRLNITLKPTRVNEVLNPNFTVNYDNWDYTGPVDHVEVTSTSGITPHIGLSGSALEVYPSLTLDIDEIDVYTEVADIIPGEYYTFSMYGAIGYYGTSPSTSDEMHLKVQWFDNADLPLDTVAGSEYTVGDSRTYRREEEDTWATENPVLNEGSVGVDTELVTASSSPYPSHSYLNWKVGDGATPWNQLPYASAGVTFIQKPGTGAGAWAGSDVLPNGYIGINTDDGTFKIGDGVTTWSSLAYTTSLPAWMRMSVTDVAPENAAKAVLSVVWTPSTKQTALLVDEALFEKSPFTNPFFDGDVGLTDTTSTMWEDGGTPNDCRSYFYRNWTYVSNRLEQVLPDYLPAGSTFKIYHAQP